MPHVTIDAGARGAPRRCMGLAAISLPACVVADKAAALYQ
jgi:hypothetical protein